MPSGRLPSPKSKWYLPPDTYRSVQYFCLSYMELQKEIIELSDEIDRIGLISGQALDGLPHGTDTTDPTQKQAMKRRELVKRRDKALRKMRIIERAVEESCFTGRKAMLLAVTSNLSYERLKLTHGCPYGKNQFGRMRQQIYWRVAQKI